MKFAKICSQVKITEGGALMPMVYHVMLGREPTGSLDYLEKLQRGKGFELKFAERSLVNEAFTNAYSLVSMITTGSTQLILRKYMTAA